VPGFAELMLDDPTPSLAGKPRERAQHIHDAGRHLLALIDDVLDVTRAPASASRSCVRWSRQWAGAWR
jgi:signal transduction histidine kinase